MEIFSRQIGPVTVVELEGHMNLNSMRWLQESLEEWVAGGQMMLVFSLRDVTLISSSGLGALIQFSQDFKKREGRLALAALHQTGKEVMAITKLDTLFEIYESIEEAVERLREQA